MALALDDTIVAIASPIGGAARGIVRLSGPNVITCLSRCLVAAVPTDLAAQTVAKVISGYVPLGRQRLPVDLYLWPTGRSYTGQPAAELHTLGSPPLLQAAVRAVCQAGARLAEPGEFTLRAFLSGRLDLPQAEAVLGVIDATNSDSLQVALQQLAGGLSGPLAQLRNHLLDTCADIEAGLDFVEEDIEFISNSELVNRLRHAADTIRATRHQMDRRGVDADHYRVALVGAPNVGKSSLLNSLSKNSAALVSEQSGTTRDYVTQLVEFHGAHILLIDTAGVDSSPKRPGPDRAAQEMAAMQAKNADIRILCIDGSRHLYDAERRMLAALDETADLIVLTKCDLAGDGYLHAPELPQTCLETSTLAGTGLAELRQAIASRVQAGASRAPIMVSATMTRCRENLRQSGESLDTALRLAIARVGDELIAAELRAALDELGKVVGTVYTEDILDRIFSRFCIGK